MIPMKLSNETKDYYAKKFREQLDSYELIPEGTVKFSIGSPKSKSAEAFLYFTEKAYMKTLLFLAKCQRSEVGWEGLVVRGEADNEYVLEDIFLYPQMVTGSTVRGDQEEIAEWKRSFSDEEFNKLRFFCHSHVNMSAFPSGKDSETQYETASQLRGDQFWIAMIMNRALESWVKIYDHKTNRIYEDKDIVIIYPEVAGVASDDIDDEIEENLRTYQHQGAGNTNTYDSPYSAGNRRDYPYYQDAYGEQTIYD